MDKKLPLHQFPKRKFCAGPKKMVSMRLPIVLLSKLEEVATSEGHSVTDLVMTAMDEWLQWAERNRK